MNTLYAVIGASVGAVTLLTLAWRLGYWQAKQEARIAAQNEEIDDLREDLEKGSEDDE